MVIEKIKEMDKCACIECKTNSADVEVTLGIKAGQTNTPGVKLNLCFECLWDLGDLIIGDTTSADFERVMK